MLPWLAAFGLRASTSDAESSKDTADGASPSVSVADATKAVEGAKEDLLAAERVKAAAVLAAADKASSNAAKYTKAAAAAQESAKASTAAADGAAAAAAKDIKAAAAAQESAKASAAALAVHGGGSRHATRVQVGEDSIQCRISRHQISNIPAKRLTYGSKSAR